MNFLNNIKNTLGKATSEDMKNIINTNKKLTSIRYRRRFLLKCRQQDIIYNQNKFNIKNITLLFAENQLFMEPESYETASEELDFITQVNK